MVKTIAQNFIEISMTHIVGIAIKKRCEIFNWPLPRYLHTGESESDFNVITMDYVVYTRACKSPRFLKSADCGLFQKNVRADSADFADFFPILSTTMPNGRNSKINIKTGFSVIQPVQ